MKKILDWYYRKKYRNAEMVKYWLKADSAPAKVTRAPEGHYVMYVKGEKYPFPGYPRGVLLFGPLSPLKHEIKNQIFNRTWYELEKNLTPVGEENLLEELKDQVLPRIQSILEAGRHNVVPYEQLVPPVKELWRAFEAVEKETKSRKVAWVKELICFVLQEDDAYRFRFQWLCKFFNPNALWRKITRRSVLQDFDFALSMLEHGETIGDMKERQRLLRRVLMFVLKDEHVRHCFDLLCKEIDWRKLRLSDADKYYFRAKYFKVDYPEFDY